jgi:hypothetical protein
MPLPMQHDSLTQEIRFMVSPILNHCCNRHTYANTWESFRVVRVRGEEALRQHLLSVGTASIPV